MRALYDTESTPAAKTVVRSVIFPPAACLFRETSVPAGTALIRAINQGLPWVEIEALQEILGVPLERLGPMLGISNATLHRRKIEGRLGREESDRVIRFARLMGRALEVLESESNARQWLSSAQYGLGGEIPLQFAETEVGAREVEDLLTRIEHGVYS